MHRTERCYPEVLDRPLRCVVLGVLIISLSACSSTTFFYNRLDTLIGWYIDDYITLTKEQEQLFDVRVDHFLDWHRREELPLYVLILDEMEVALERQPLTNEDVDALYTALDGAVNRLQDKVLQAVLEYGATLSKEQRLEFLAQLAKKSGERREERLARSDAEYYEATAERFIDNFEDYLGSLNDDQEQAIRHRTADFIRLDASWFDSRFRWLEELRVIIEADEPHWPALVAQATNTRSEHWLPSLKKGFAHNKTIAFAIMGEVLNSRTVRQDKHLRRELQAYRDDFLTLAAAAPVTEPDAVPQPIKSSVGR